MEKEGGGSRVNKSLRSEAEIVGHWAGEYRSPLLPNPLSIPHLEWDNHSRWLTSDSYICLSSHQQNLREWRNRVSQISWGEGLTEGVDMQQPRQGSSVCPSAGSSVVWRRPMWNAMGVSEKSRRMDTACVSPFGSCLHRILETQSTRLMTRAGRKCRGGVVGLGPLCGKHQGQSSCPTN